MPTVQRTTDLALNYELDDYTDPWSDAPFLLLQHGNGRSAKFWYRWIPYLSRYYRIIRPDMRGLGKSTFAQPPADLERELTLDALIGDLGAILDHAGARQVHYCGESMGGILGLALAAMHPARVATLSLVATPVFINDAVKQRYALGHGSRTDAMEKLGVRAWVEATTKTTRLPAESEPDLFRWYVDEFAKGDQAVQVAMSKLVNAADASSLLPRVSAPVLGLFPTGGQITSVEQEAMLRKGLSATSFELIHLPTQYHMVQLLFPATCAGHVLRFCAAHDGRTITER